MKKWMITLFTFLIFSIKPLHAAGGPCLDTFRDMTIVHWYIIQKLGTHLYELRSDTGNLHMLLKTKRAVFNRPGMPYGIKVRSTGEFMQLPLENGFTQSYGEFVECGIVPIIPYDNMTPGLLAQHGYVVRERLKEDRKSVK